MQELAEFVNSHPEVTVDVGQVLFGETTSMTGDGPLGYYLHKVTGKNGRVLIPKWKQGAASCPWSIRKKFCQCFAMGYRFGMVPSG